MREAAGRPGPKQRESWPCALLPQEPRSHPEEVRPQSTPQQRRTGVEAKREWQQGRHQAQLLSKKSTEHLACAGTSKALRMYYSCNPQIDHSGGGAFYPHYASEEVGAQRLSGLPKLTQLERQSRTQPRQTAPESMPRPLLQGEPEPGWRGKQPELCTEALAGPVPTPALRGTALPLQLPRACYYHTDACRVPGTLQAPSPLQLGNPHPCP